MHRLRDWKLTNIDRQRVRIYNPYIAILCYNVSSYESQTESLSWFFFVFVADPQMNVCILYRFAFIHSHLDHQQLFASICRSFSIRNIWRGRQKSALVLYTNKRIKVHLHHTLTAQKTQHFCVWKFPIRHHGHKHIAFISLWHSVVALSHQSRVKKPIQKIQLNLFLYTQ